MLQLPRLVPSLLAATATVVLASWEIVIDWGDDSDPTILRYCKRSSGAYANPAKIYKEVPHVYPAGVSYAYNVTLTTSSCDGERKQIDEYSGSVNPAGTPGLPWGG